MTVTFRASFAKDLRTVTDAKMLARVRVLIQEVEKANGLMDLPQLKRLQGPGRYYRIRLGDYRAGLAVEGETVAFVRFLHRKEIYRYFP